MVNKQDLQNLQDANKLELQNLADKISKDNHALNCRIDALVNGLGKFTEEINSWKDVIEGKLKENGAAINTALKKVHNIEEEIIWRERKKRQIIINGVNESNAPTGSARSEEDKASVANILEAMGCAEKFKDMKFTRRVGKASPASHRPICVGFIDESSRDQVLRYTGKLKDSRLKDVNIQADLTRMQRQTFKDQLELVKHKNATKEGLQEGQEWRIVGPRGDTRVIRAAIRK